MAKDASSLRRFTQITGLLSVLALAGILLALLFWSPEEPAGEPLERRPAIRVVKKAPGRVALTESRAATASPGVVRRVMKKADGSIVEAPEGQRFEVVEDDEGKLIERVVASSSSASRAPSVPEAVLNKTGLRGKVVDRQKRAIAGATVKVVASGGFGPMENLVIGGDFLPGRHRPEARALGAATSDADGLFEISGIDPAGRHRLIIEPPEGFLTARHSCPSLRAGEIIDAGRLEVRRPGSLSGLVVDPGGRPVAGARVRIVNAKGAPPIVFDDENADEEEGEDGKSRTTSATIVMRADDSDGELQILGGQWEATKTDEQGRFRFEALAPSSYTLTASKRGFRMARLAEIEVKEEQRSDDVRLALGPGGRVLVTVLNELGEPVLGARVKLSAGFAFGIMISQGNDAKADGVETDANGQARFQDLTKPSYNVLVTAEGYARGSKGINLAEGEEETVCEVKLERGTRVTGRLFRKADREPVADAFIHIGPERLRDPRGEPEAGEQGPPSWSPPSFARSDAQGRFEFPNLGPGRYRLHINAPELRPLQRPLEVQIGAELLELGDILLDGLASLEVTVIDQEGEPVVGARVSASGDSPYAMRLRSSSSESEDGEEEVETNVSIGGPPGTAITDEKGVAYCKEVTPGVVNVKVTKKGLPDAFAENITVSESGGPTRITISLPLGARITGRVLNSSGEPVPQARLTLFRQGYRWSIRSVTADAEGRFQMTGIAPGEYRLKPGAAMMQTSQSAADTFTVRDGETLTRDVTAPESSKGKSVGGR